MDSDSDSSSKITAQRKKVATRAGKAAGPTKGAAARSSSDSDDDFDLVAAAKSSRAKQVQSGRADQSGSPSRPISRTTSAKAGSSGDKSFPSRPASPVKASSPQLVRQNTGPRQQQQQQQPADSESDSDFELLTAPSSPVSAAFEPGASPDAPFVSHQTSQYPSASDIFNQSVDSDEGLAAPMQASLSSPQAAQAVGQAVGAVYEGGLAAGHGGSGAAVDECAQDLRSDIQHLEATWARKWEEQGAATACLQAGVDASGQEINTRLEGVLGELAAQRRRLDMVEEAQANSLRTAALAQPPAPPTQLALEAAAVTCNPVFESKPTSPTGLLVTLPPESPAHENTGNNAASATCQQLFADIGVGGLVHSSPRSSPRRLSDIPSRLAITPSRLTVSACSGSSSAGGRVDRQVAETQRLIAGIQDQIAQIKGSLSDLGCSGRVEQEGMGRRLAQLEQSQRAQQDAARYKAVLCQAQADQAVELARRVRALEGKVASLQQRADDSGVDLSLRVGALEWRLDKSSGATLDTLMALERRQDRLYDQLAGVRDTSTAASSSLSGEMARLSRKVAAHCVTARPLFRNY
ncbi:hypothetical protein N2152v2_010803 [Parachlorella kessleri]